MNFTQDQIMQIIGNEAARLVNRAGPFKVKLIVRSRGDETTVEAETEEVK